MPIELKMPDPKDYDSPVKYCEAFIAAQEEYRKACFRAIDRRPTLTTERAKKDYRQHRTIADYLSEHPNLIKRYKEIGAMALLEL